MVLDEPYNITMSLFDDTALDNMKINPVSQFQVPFSPFFYAYGIRWYAQRTHFLYFFTFLLVFLPFYCPFCLVYSH